MVTLTGSNLVSYVLLSTAYNVTPPIFAHHARQTTLFSTKVVYPAWFSLVYLVHRRTDVRYVTGCWSLLVMDLYVLFANWQTVVIVRLRSTVKYVKKIIYLFREYAGRVE